MEKEPIIILSNAAYGMKEGSRNSMFIDMIA